MLNYSDSGHDLTTQKLFEHQIISRFDHRSTEQNPIVGYLKLCLLGFGVVRIVGLIQGKLRLEILGSKSIIEDLIHRPKYGLKFVMELRNGSTLHNFSLGFFSPFTFPNIDVARFDERNEIPGVGDIWIPNDYASPNYFIRFFILEIKRLF